MESFFGAAAVAAASGLAFIAYKHPEGYKRLARILSFIYVVLAVVALTWGLAVGASKSTAGLVLDSAARTRVNQALSTLQLAAWVPWSALGTIFYVWVLELLPNFTGKEHSQDR
jgi:hypothetical protein